MAARTRWFFFEPIVSVHVDIIKETRLGEFVKWIASFPNELDDSIRNFSNARTINREDTRLNFLSLVISGIQVTFLQLTRRWLLDSKIPRGVTACSTREAWPA